MVVRPRGGCARCVVERSALSEGKLTVRLKKVPLLEVQCRQGEIMRIYRRDGLVTAIASRSPAIASASMSAALPGHAMHSGVTARRRP